MVFQELDGSVIFIPLKPSISSCNGLLMGGKLIVYVVGVCPQTLCVKTKIMNKLKIRKNLNFEITKHNFVNKLNAFFIRLFYLNKVANVYMI
jgi:hypothetical protein